MEEYGFCSLSQTQPHQCPPPPPPSLQPPTLSEGSGSTSGWDTVVHTGEETLALLFPLTTPRRRVKPANDAGSWVQAHLKVQNLQTNTPPGSEPAQRARRAERKTRICSFSFPGQLGAVT